MDRSLPNSLHLCTSHLESLQYPTADPRPSRSNGAMNKTAVINKCLRESNHMEMLKFKSSATYLFGIFSEPTFHFPVGWVLYRYTRGIYTRFLYIEWVGWGRSGAKKIAFAPAHPKQVDRLQYNKRVS